MKTTNRVLCWTMPSLVGAFVFAAVKFGNLAIVARSSVEANAAEENAELGNHIMKTMEFVRSPLSETERQVTAQLLVTIANNTFDTLDSKKDWIRVLAIESQFVQAAKNPSSATGIGQLLPSYASSFGKLCGMKKVVAKDLDSILVNAQLSACVWRHNLEIAPDHSVVLALSGYNSGPNSSSTKNIQHLGSAVPETANYIMKFSYLKEVTTPRASMERK